MKIPLVDLNAQYISIKPEIDNTISEVIKNSSFIMGKPLKNFEENLANYLNLSSSENAIGVSSGSSALFLALKAYGIGPGDEVITAPNTFIATAEAIVHCGARPVFADIDERTMLIDTSEIVSKINSSTKAVIPVHLYGQCADMDEIVKIATNYNLKIIEDAAQAIGTQFKSLPLPIHETATLSFFPSKNLGCYGDGGAVITKNQSIAKKIAKLRDHGRIDKYNSDSIGYGERLDALQAAILTVKLPYLNEWTHKRRENAQLYNSLLSNLPQIELPFETQLSRHVYYVYVIRTQNRDDLASYLAEKGISSGVHYPIPLHLQPAFSNLGYEQGDFPASEKSSKEILSLPMFPELTRKEIEYIVNNITSFYARNKNSG